MFYLGLDPSAVVLPLVYVSRNAKPLSRTTDSLVISVFLEKQGVSNVFGHELFWSILGV